MARKHSLVFFLLFALAALASTAFALDMRPGKWEITSQVAVAGMPMQMPAVTMFQCLTREKPAPAGGGKNNINKHCRIQDVKIKGNTVRWTLTCNEQGKKMISNGAILYRGDRFTGVIITRAVENGQPMEITTKLTGKRVGVCD